jgi:hypothetical protein
VVHDKELVMDNVGSSLGLDGIGSPSEAGNAMSHAEEF